MFQLLGGLAILLGIPAIPLLPRRGFTRRQPTYARFHLAKTQIINLLRVTRSFIHLQHLRLSRNSGDLRNHRVLHTSPLYILASYVLDTEA